MARVDDKRDNPACDVDQQPTRFDLTVNKPPMVTSTPT
jgi:hypothetical protein